MNDEGKIDVLNTGHGHLEFRFNNNDQIELDRAKRAVTDMIKRGFVLFIEGDDGKLTRVERFDESKGVYIIADGDAALAPIGEAILESETIEARLDELEEEKRNPEKSRKGRWRVKKTAVPMQKAKVTAIGRSAGG